MKAIKYDNPLVVLSLKLVKTCGRSLIKYLRAGLLSYPYSKPNSHNVNLKFRVQRQHYHYRSLQGRILTLFT